jgi:hypothetical protein
MSERFTLVGPNAGKTITLGTLGNEYTFVDGVLDYNGSPEDALRLGRVLTSFYSAYPQSQLRDAQERYAALVAETLGHNEPAAVVTEEEDDKADAAAAEAKRLADEAETKRLADEAETKRLADEAEAKRLADEAETKRLADEAETKRLADEAEAKRLADEAEAKRLADEAEAKRLADEEDTPPLTLAQIVKTLDPENDEHWTDRGLPSMTAIETLAGKPSTRKDVEEAVPGYTRAVARSEKALG